MNTILLASAISANPLINNIFTLFIYGLIIGILIYLVTIAPFLPPIFKQVLTFLLYVVAAIVLINFLLSFVGQSFIK